MPDDSLVTGVGIPGEISNPVPLGLFASSLKRLEVDHAVVFMIATRVAQMATFPVTLLLIARCLSPELQGFYYTFSSVMALQMFVELGLTYVIVNVASHEWAGLSLDENGVIAGDPEALSRLVSLGRLLFKWYAGAAGIFLVGASTAGWLFFHFSTSSPVHWQAPLMACIAVSSLLLWALPFNALLEGCNQVGQINRLRLTQTLVEAAALWTTLLLGGGLWAAAVAISAKVLRDCYLLFVQYRRFFRPFIRLKLTSRINWRTEIWPMQWRLAIAGVATYFGSSLYNPVMFRFHGPAAAGRMGMTMQLVAGLQLVPMAWVLTKAPGYGVLVARKQFAMLDRIWLRNSVISVVVMLLMGLSVWVIVLLLNIWSVPLAGRILTPGMVALLLLAALMLQICQCLVAYLRAHKREPILVANVTTALLGAVLVYFLGKALGPLGAAFANAAQMVLTAIWIGVIWHQSRAAWHA